MRNDTTPKTLIRYIARSPHLYALLLAFSNRLSSALRRPFFLGVYVAASVGAVIAMSFGIRSVGPRLFGEWLAFLDAHIAWVAMLAVLHSAVTVNRRYSSAMDHLRGSWLAATSQSVRTRRSSVIIAACWVPVAQLIICAVALAIFQLLSDGDARTTHRIVSALGGGFACGMLLGPLLPRKRRSTRPGSRYVPGKKAAPIPAVASLSALSRWPVASAFAWATPNTVRWPLMAAMLSVMAGTPALIGLAVVSFWMLVMYMVALYSATLRVAKESAAWLRSSPLSLGKFLVAIGLRSLVHQCLAAAVIAACVALETKSFWQPLVLVTPWIAFVLVAYTIAIVHAYHSRRGTRVSILLSAMSLGIAEVFQRGASLPLALAISTGVWRFAASPPNNHSDAKVRANG